MTDTIHTLFYKKNKTALKLAYIIYSVRDMDRYIDSYFNRDLIYKVALMYKHCNEDQVEEIAHLIYSLRDKEEDITYRDASDPILLDILDSIIKGD